MNTLAFATISELQEKLQKKEISREELLTYFIERFKKYDAQDIQSALEIYDPEFILSQSAEQGPLAGIPGLIKDNISQAGCRLSCASRILQNFQAAFDATAINRLKKNGALMIGRANMDEFAMGSSTETSAYAKTKNPWDTTRVPGGSSGGSAAAVAAGFVPWSLGSDTGGSVRQPAAFCGVVGLKPTYGLVSRLGLVAYGSSLDQIGIFSRTVRDNALILSAIAGHDMRDSTSLLVEKKDYTQSLNPELSDGLRIGVVDAALRSEGMDPEIVAAIEAGIKEFEKLGAKIKNIELPTLSYSAAAYFILSRAEAASNLARFDGVRYGMRNKDAKTLAEMYCKTRHDGFGPEVRSRIMVGNYVLSAGHSGQFYDNAKVVQNLIRHEFMQAFKDVDMLIMPVHPAPAFTFGAFDIDKLQMDLQDYFTCPANLAGVPALSIPCGFTQSGMPIGMQLIGPHVSEGLLYRAAYAYEQQTSWHTMHPKNL